PREADLSAPLAQDLTVARELEVAPHVPPDVGAGRVHQLELEVVRRDLASHPETKDVILRQIERYRAPDDRVAGAVDESNVEPKTASMNAGVGCERERHALGGMGRPRGYILEPVHQHRAV